MKKIIIAILAVALISIGGIFIFGQKGFGKRGGFYGGRGGGVGGPGFSRMAEKLSLNDEQKTQIKQILEDSKTRIQPLMQNLKKSHEESAELGKDGVYNDEPVQTLAAQQAETTRQMFIEKEKTKAAIFAVLTPEQRTQAEQMKNQMKERFKNKFKKRSGDKNSPNKTNEE